MTDTKLDGPSHGPHNGGRPGHLVILLHGYGADGNDLIDLGRMFAPILPDTAFVSPHAPDPCDQAPMGRQWFPLWDRTPSQLEAGVRMAAGILNAWLDEQIAARGLTPAQVALMGFSQGAMTSLFAALRRPAPIPARSSKLRSPISAKSRIS